MKKWFATIGVLVILLAISDYLAFPILSELMFKGEKISYVISREVFLYTIVSVAGIYSLNRVSEDIFFKSTDKRKKIARGLGLGLIVANTGFYIYSLINLNDNTLLLLLQENYLGALGISIRAGITEELLFRFFLINSILFMGSGLTSNSKKIKYLAIIISSIAFIFIHPLNSAFITLISGLVLGYIYFELGLIPAILVHTLGNLVPFSLLGLNIIG